MNMKQLEYSYESYTEDELLLNYFEQNHSLQVFTYHKLLAQT